MSSDFEWDDANILHIARHDVAIDEAESALSGYTLERTFRVVDGEERFTEIGVTNAGRFLEITSTLRADCVRVITAYDAPRDGIREYLENR